MSYSPKLLITGGQGQLAQALLAHSLAKSFVIKVYPKALLDITEPEQIDSVLSQEQPDWIINTAAFTAVDQAEVNETLARAVNVTGPTLLAKACEKMQIQLIHFSTDYIFDGLQQRPYLEEDEPAPLNCYGRTKLQGEEQIRSACEKHLIIRVSGLFSEYGHNFVKTILRLLQERKTLSIVADQLTCLTYAGDLAQAVFTLMHKKTWGTYHFANEAPLSWYEFTRAIQAQAEQIQPLAIGNILPISAAAYAAQAKRPTYSVLDCKKIVALGIPRPTWHEGLRQVISTLMKGKD